MGPTSFFYFSSIRDEERKSWLKKLLLERQMYFRERSKLNDVNELRPNLILGGNSKQQNQYLDQIIKKHVSTRLSRAEQLIKRAEIKRQLEKDPYLFEPIFHELLEKVGILSLSDDLNADTLWGNYADSYRGVCVEFDANRGLFLAANQVKYEDVLPTVSRLQDSSETRIQKSLFTKRRAWASEREWRVVARWRDPERQMQSITNKSIPADLKTFILTQHGPGYYEIPENAVRAIIIGANVQKYEREWLEALATELNVVNLLVETTKARDGSVCKVA